MPTIQLKMTDEQFEHLTNMMNEKTATKAILNALTELEELRFAFTELYKDYQSVVITNNQHQLRFSMFNDFLTYSQKYADESPPPPLIPSDYFNRLLP